MEDPTTGSGTVDGKSPIVLSVGGVDSPDTEVTRAVITDGTGKTLHRLPKGSSIYMLMKADDLSDSHKTALCTRTVGFAQDIAGKDYSNVSFTASGEGAKFTRYWDDIFARKSALSIAAVCTPGYGPSAAGASTADSKAWRIGGDGSFINNKWIPITEMGSTAPNLYWPVAYSGPVTDQSKQGTTPDFITYQDLCFSNNIGDNTSQGKGDTRLKFIEGDKKFSSGKLIFYHALSKLTFNIKKGEGFSDSEFIFQTGTNIKLSNFNNGGTFNISTGEFEGVLSKTDINKIFQRTLTSAETTAGIKYGLDALVIPGTNLSDAGASTTNAVTFILAGNEYKLTMAQLYAAFTDEQKGNTTYFEGGKLKAGVHYVFTFTVGKTTINSITAQVADWEEVAAENINPQSDNISVTTAVLSGHKKDADNFDLYRLPYVSPAAAIDLGIKNYDWVGRYTDKATLSGPSENKWSTNWYWESNKHFYHFRAVSPKAVDPETTTVHDGGTGKDDYLTLATGKYSSTASESYKDVLWGAPFLAPTGANNKYGYDPDSKGFDGTSAPTTHQIHHGIVTTTSTINLLLFHIMSEVTFNITTTTGADKVLLQTTTGEPAVTTDTKVELIEYYEEGKVLMGNGLVQTTGSKSTENAGYNLTLESYTAESSPNAAKSVFHYGVVPQSLANVKLRITTPDNNQYTVNLAGAKVSSGNITSNNLANPYRLVGGTGADKDKYIIDSWYPGFKYNYTFTLKKSGIIDITATILDWENISADNEDVTIK